MSRTALCDSDHAEVDARRYNAQPASPGARRRRQKAGDLRPMAIDIGAQTV
jgi:hypothetical protein